MLLLLWTPYPIPALVPLPRRLLEPARRRPFRRPDDEDLLVAIL